DWPRIGALDDAGLPRHLGLVKPQEIVAEAIERHHVGGTGDERLEGAAGREDGADGLGIEGGPLRRSVAQQMVAHRVVAGVRAWDGIGEPFPEGVGERAVGAVVLHDEVGEINGLAAVAGRQRERRGDGHERPRVLREGQAADEGGGKIRSCPELLELRGKRVVDDLERNAALRRDPLEETPPGCGGAGCHGIHTSIGDAGGHGHSAKTRRWPSPIRRAFSSMAWPNAMSVMLRPRCQTRIVSRSLSRPGSFPATIWPSSAWSVCSESLPASTWARSAPNGP